MIEWPDREWVCRCNKEHTRHQLTPDSMTPNQGAIMNHGTRQQSAPLKIQLPVPRIPFIFYLVNRPRTGSRRQSSLHQLPSRDRARSSDRLPPSRRSIIAYRGRVRITSFQFWAIIGLSNAFKRLLGQGTVPSVHVVAVVCHSVI